MKSAYFPDMQRLLEIDDLHLYYSDSQMQVSDYSTEEDWKAEMQRVRPLGGLRVSRVNVKFAISSRWVFLFIDTSV
jgi:hypothetical protein